MSFFKILSCHDAHPVLCKAALIQTHCSCVTTMKAHGSVSKPAVVNLGIFHQNKAQVLWNILRKNLASFYCR